MSLEHLRRTEDRLPQPRVRPGPFPICTRGLLQPRGQEIGTAAQLLAVFDAYGVQHALVVGPNSGYDTDSRCLLDVLEQGQGRLKGAAVVPDDISRSELVDLRAAGVLGITFQAALMGVDYYAKSSRQAYPYQDAWPFVRALIDAYGFDALLWGSDWPFLRATERFDYGPLLKLVERLIPEPADRRKVLWDTPRTLFTLA